MVFGATVLTFALASSSVQHTVPATVGFEGGEVPCQAIATGELSDDGKLIATVDLQLDSLNGKLLSVLQPLLPEQGPYMPGEPSIAWVSGGFDLTVPYNAESGEPATFTVHVAVERSKFMALYEVTSFKLRGAEGYGLAGGNPDQVSSAIVAWLEAVGPNEIHMTLGPLESAKLKPVSYEIGPNSQPIMRFVFESKLPKKKRAAAYEAFAAWSAQ